MAGPFNAPSSWQRELNIRRAEELVHRINALADTCAVYTHAYGRIWVGDEYEEKALAIGIELVRRSDGVCLVDGWETSFGTREEIITAGFHQRPVYVSYDALAYGAPTAIHGLLPRFRLGQDRPA